ncbi:MAG: hypothetical protein FJ272_08545, partial [Planctomycetes bacterium]|nr:hypothetical protein [Planctomycetota bacterium]
MFGSANRRPNTENRQPKTEHRPPRRGSTINLRQVEKLALLVPAAASVLLATAYLCASARQATGWTAWLTTPMACGAFVAGFAAALAALALPRLRLQNAVLTKELRISEKQVRYVEEKSKGLQGQVELLTAMREVTRVVSEDVDFERILEHVLKIVEDLVEAEEMTLYLLDE